MKLYVVTTEYGEEIHSVCLTEELAKAAVADEIIHKEPGNPEEFATYKEVQLNTGGEPIFVLRGQDMFAECGIVGYQTELLSHRVLEQADQVSLALEEMQQWQESNANRLKVPDHRHVPVSGEVENDPLRCSTCGSRQPSMHPAVSGGGEVTSICPDKFHDVTGWGVKG